MATANFIGVYSSAGAQRSRKRYWFVWTDSQGGNIVQLLSAAFQPVGEPRRVESADFTRHFTPETSIYVIPVSKLELPDEDLPEEKQYVPADLDAESRKSSTASPLQEAARLAKNLQGEFATALAKLHRGDRISAVNAFEKLAKRREGIVPAHKHMFTNFAVDLRKSRLPSVAFKFYQRALELSPEDSNAYFNMARIMFDLGDFEGTEHHLQQALNLDAKFTDARLFLDYLHKKRSSANQTKRRSAAVSRHRDLLK